jgi:hypothetical protein
VLAASEGGDISLIRERIAWTAWVGCWCLTFVALPFVLVPFVLSVRANFRPDRNADPVGRLRTAHRACWWGYGLLATLLGFLTVALFVMLLRRGGFVGWATEDLTAASFALLVGAAGSAWASLQALADLNAQEAAMPEQSPTADRPANASNDSITAGRTDLTRRPSPRGGEAETAS